MQTETKFYDWAWQQPTTPVYQLAPSRTLANRTSANKTTDQMCPQIQSIADIWGIIKQETYQGGRADSNDGQLISQIPSVIESDAKVPRKLFRASLCARQSFVSSAMMVHDTQGFGSANGI